MNLIDDIDLQIVKKDFGWQRMHVRAFLSNVAERHPCQGMA
ncbi:MAG: hypothetical protein Q7T78_08175 [Rhodoferax sp.]|jgi:hypothetical protein|nr:hypothetical protein [Rhodoferax sp.]